MKIAYVDSSCIVALAFRETPATALRRKLKRYDTLVSAALWFSPDPSQLAFPTLDAAQRSVAARVGFPTE